MARDSDMVLAQLMGGPQDGAMFEFPPDRVPETFVFRGARYTAVGIDRSLGLGLYAFHRIEHPASQDGEGDPDAQ